MSVKSFTERRSNILEEYNRVKKNDLETLNSDIDQQINENNEEIKRVEQENKELASLKTNNTSTIKALAKLFS